MKFVLEIDMDPEKAPLFGNSADDFDDYNSSLRWQLGMLLEWASRAVKWAPLSEPMNISCGDGVRVGVAHFRD